MACSLSPLFHFLSLSLFSLYLAAHIPLSSCSLWMYMCVALRSFWVSRHRPYLGECSRLIVCFPASTGDSYALGIYVIIAFVV